MAPYEVMLSESQERMLAVVEAGAEERVMARPATGGPARGRHRAGHRTLGRLEVREGGELVADLPIELLDRRPDPSRSRRVRPSWLDERHGSDAVDVPPPADLEAAFLRLSGRPGHRQPHAGLLDVRPHGRDRHRRRARR